MVSEVEECLPVHQLHTCLARRVLELPDTRPEAQRLLKRRWGRKGRRTPNTHGPRALQQGPQDTGQLGNEVHARPGEQPVTPSKPPSYKYYNALRCSFTAAQRVSLPEGVDTVCSLTLFWWPWKVQAVVLSHIFETFTSCLVGALFLQGLPLISARTIIPRY